MSGIALVTGGSGFVGGHLAEALLRAGRPVTALVRPSSDRRRLAALSLPVRTARLDDPDGLCRAMRDVEIVYHVAGRTRGRTEREYFETNVEGTRKVLAAARRSPSARRFLYVSSLAAAGPAPGPAPLDEAAPARPLDSYGRSKLAAEEVVRGEAGDLPFTIVRPPAVYGPRDPNFLPLFRGLRRLPLAPIIGPLRQELSLVHVADLVAGIRLAAEIPRARGRTYYLSGGIHRREEILAAVQAALGVRRRHVRVPDGAARLLGAAGEIVWALTGRPQNISRRKIEDMLQERWTCRHDRATRDLGYRPTRTLREGMRETARSYTEAGLL